MHNDFRVFGLEIAEVEEVEKNSHRVKLKFEAWSKDEVSHWAPVATFMAGKEMGFYCLPNEGDKVLVAFHQGNRHEPYVIGSLWTDKQKPPVTDENTDSDRNQDGKNLLRYWKTQSGHMIIMDDTKDKEKIQIIDKTGDKRIEMCCGQSDDDQIITIENAKGPMKIKAPKGKITIDCEELEIKTEKTMKIESGEKLTVTGSDEIEIKASKDMKIKGSNVETEAQQSAKVKGNSSVETKGAQIKVEASATLTLKSSGISELKGSLVKIN